MPFVRGKKRFTPFETKEIVPTQSKLPVRGQETSPSTPMSTNNFSGVSGVEFVDDESPLSPPDARSQHSGVSIAESHHFNSEYHSDQFHLLQTRVIDMDSRVWTALRRIEEVLSMAGSARGTSRDNQDRMRVLDQRIETLEVTCKVEDGHSPRNFGDVASRIHRLEESVRSLQEAVRYLEVQQIATDGPNSFEVAFADPKTLQGLQTDLNRSRSCEFYSMCQGELDPRSPRVHDVADIFNEAQAGAIDSLQRRLEVLEKLPLLNATRGEVLDVDATAKGEAQAEAMASLLRRLTHLEGCLQSERIKAMWQEAQAEAMEAIMRRRSQELDAKISAQLDKTLREKIASSGNEFDHTPTEQKLSTISTDSVLRMCSRGPGSGEQPDSQVGSMDELHSMVNALAETVKAHSMALEKASVNVSPVQPTSEQALQGKSFPFVADDIRALSRALTSCETVLDCTLVRLVTAIAEPTAVSAEFNAVTTMGSKGSEGVVVSADDSVASARRGPATVGKSNGSSPTYAKLATDGRCLPFARPELVARLTAVGALNMEHCFAFLKPPPSGHA